MAGGFSTRLYPLTKIFPKPLLTINEKPIIEHILEKMDEVTIVDKIIISTNKKFEYHFKNWVNTFKSKNPIELEVEESREEKEKLGAIKGIHRIYEKYPNEDFLIVAGDNYFDEALTNFVDFYKNKKGPVIAVYRPESNFNGNQFGQVKLDNNGIVEKFIEKQNNSEKNYIATCIYAIPNKSMQKIQQYVEMNYSKDSPGNFIEWLTDRDTIYGFILKGGWWDIGTIESYENIQKKFSALK